MCGICGFLSRDQRLAADTFQPAALAMARTLTHRGPDDFGVWEDAEAGIAFGHRRLSILDLSAAGRQPMLSHSGRLVIVYNGEIYNFLELRQELEGFGHMFRGHSDTEVLLEAIDEWGVQKTLTRIQGMFAFALWDQKERTLTLARDRVGKKPLYYGWCGHTFLFGSELRALRAHPHFDSEIDRNALGLLIQYGWIPSPHSIFQYIHKLPPGAMLTVKHRDSPSHVTPQTYWSAREAAERGERSPFPGSLEDAADEIETLLRDAVRRRMVADVSLGALLSGGIDSTTVVSIMQSLDSRPVKTFTIGFLEPRYNEAEYAKAVAGYLHTEHTELTLTPADAIEVIPQLPTIYDEPFADASQIPTFLVARLARGEVTVALSGDGGDEVFAGYSRYVHGLRFWDSWRHVPLLFRRVLANITKFLSHQGWAAFGPNDVRMPKEIEKWPSFPAKLEKRTRLLPASNPVALTARMHALCESGSQYVISAGGLPSALTDANGWARTREPLLAMMCLDFISSLPDDMLVKVDRASMAVGLEVRCPLLDHRIVEFAWSLPVSMFLGDGGGKRVLRRVLERYVPRRLTERRKQVFAVPITEWLRGPLYEWGQELLDAERLRREGFFIPAAVKRVWNQHLSGWRKHSGLLWSILMFQAWYQSSSRVDRGMGDAPTDRMTPASCFLRAM